MDKAQRKRDSIKEGMQVEDSRGDLGEQDLSKPKIEEIVRDEQGHVERLIVEKGVLFKKELDIPGERIRKVIPGNKKNGGKVIITSEEAELEALKATGREKLETEQEMKQQQQSDFLSEIEEGLPTAEGLRNKERRNRARAPETEQFTSTNLRFWLMMIGPGFLAGMAGNDASAVGTYAIDGAQNGFGHLWLMLLSTPLYQAVQFACAKLGRITQKGLAEILREYYGRKVAIPAASVLVVANIALIAADLVAVSNGFSLLTHIPWPWFVVPLCIVLWYLVVYSNFNRLKKIFVVLSLAFVVYIITGILARPDWGSVLFNTFVPHLSMNFATVSSAVALLGATISPYNIFWQVQGEKEEKRPGTQKQKFRFAALDIGVGVISGNVVAYFIILSTAATLFTHHKTVNSASDAAQALVPALGAFGEYCFALGLIGAGVVAIPVLLASTSYAISGTVGWPSGLSKQPWQNEGFYLILSGALVVSLVIALIGLDPIQLLFWANVLSGVLSPVLVIYLLVLCNNQRLMKGQRIGWLTNLGLLITVFVMIAATAMLFYSLFTGQG